MVVEFFYLRERNLVHINAHCRVSMWELLLIQIFQSFTCSKKDLQNAQHCDVIDKLLAVTWYPVAVTSSQLYQNSTLLEERKKLLLSDHVFYPVFPRPRNWAVGLIKYDHKREQTGLSFIVKLIITTHMSRDYSFRGWILVNCPSLESKPI